MKLKNNVKGITLIALVVTIIVLLILAGIALNLTIGQNGIFSRAQDAANTWRNAENNEQLALNDLSSWMDQYLNGNGESQEDDQGSIKVSFTIEGEKVTTPPLPSSDFSYVEGTVDTGYVIEDGEGNQFVWVPVDKNQKIKINVTSNEDIESITLTDPVGENRLTVNNEEVGTTYTNENIEPTINGPYVLNVTTSSEEKSFKLGVHSLYAIDTTADWFFTEEVALAQGASSLEEFLRGFTLEEAYVEYAKMLDGYEESNDNEDIGLNDKESVEENGGFYIGRYEASYDDSVSGGRVASKKSENTNRTGSSDALEDGMLWNYVSQIEALDKSKEMYTGISTLLTGAAWDRTLGWLEETGAVTSFEIVVDSSTWGNYSNDKFSNTNSLINTGEYDKTEKNHIYDLAGNLWEWITEASNTSSRVNRGR